MPHDSDSDDNKKSLVPAKNLGIDDPFGNTLSQALDQESLHQIVENYVRYYAGGESHTARAKRYDLNHFLLFLGGSEARVRNLRVADWTLQKTQEFIDDRLRRSEAPATVSRRLATLKHFGRTLAERVPGFINPAKEVRGPVQNQIRPHGLTAAEIALLRNASLPRTADNARLFLELRNQFLLELLLCTGLRADEVRLLSMGQLSPDLSWLKNVRTKGRKFRNVYVDTRLREFFVQYLEFRQKELLEHFPGMRQVPAADLLKYPVLISLYRAEPLTPASFQLSPKTIWRVIAAFGLRAQKSAGGTLGNLHPHRLRHTFAHGLLDSSKDIRLVAQALGHSDVRTTMRYTERSEEEIATAIESRIIDV